MLKKALLILIGMAVVAGGAPPASGRTAHYDSIDELFDAYYGFKLRINPTEATKLGERGFDDYVANFISQDHMSELAASYENFLRNIAAIENAELSDADRLSLQVMKWDCTINKQGLENPLATVASPVYGIPSFQLMPVNQIFSFNLFFGQLAGGASIHPFRTVQDYENWLQRVDDYVVWVDTAIANMKIGLDRGAVWPKVIVERAIGQLEAVITTDIKNHLYFGPIRGMPTEFPAPDKERLSAAFERMIRNEVNPAHSRLRTFLVEKYLPFAGDHTGLGALPHGQETYQYLIRYHTTTDMTSDEIFDLGRREVERISKEMEAVKDRVGYKGTLRDFFDHVRTSKAQMPFTEPGQVIANFEAIHERMNPRLRELFNVEPRAGFEVRRTEAFRENSASAEYMPGTKDGSRPGVFYVPIPDVRQYNKFSDEALFLHEAIPGHHYQLSLQQESEHLPEFLHPEGNAVFVEGWALYSESLGQELGLYEDPYQHFGMLSQEMHRAIRLVVDTGMHAKGWTREQAIQYSLDHEADSEASVVAEIERYMVAPGQALSYKIGQLKILELRDRARRVLGERFDIREFHRQVLDSGSLPLVLLEKKIDGWIASQH